MREREREKEGGGGSFVEYSELDCYTDSKDILFLIPRFLCSKAAYAFS